MAPVLTLKDCGAIRQQAQSLKRTVEQETCSARSKSEYNAKMPLSKDFTHRFTLETRLREPATLKAAGADLTRGVISLATGRPSSEYYPITNLSIGFKQADSHQEGRSEAMWPASKSEDYVSELRLAVGLPISLDYGHSQGSEANVRFLTEHTELVHQPPYSNWEVCLNAGSTSAIEHVFRMFCSRGDYILLEDYTYSGVLEAMRPLGLRSAAIEMDGEGISATSLEKLLSNWLEEDRGGPKPFLLYTIPTGHNPTGVTQTRQRREEIYAVAQRHDLLIIEDDPYYYMHYPQKPEVKGSTKQYESAASPMDKYFDSLPRSYLSMDISGRVVRLDSTSKILAPGLRCSWMTANSGIIAKFLCHHDVGIVCPSGLSQLILANLLEHTWGHNGFADWLMYLCDVYARRCETLVRACKKHLPQTLCTWHRPEAGMFLWIKINWRKHPTAGSYEDRFCAQSYSSIEQRIFDRALTKGALVCKGSAFRASSSGPSSMFLRLTFATASSEGMEEAVKRLGEAIDEEFDM